MKNIAMKIKTYAALALLLMAISIAGVPPSAAQLAGGDPAVACDAPAARQAPEARA